MSRDPARPQRASALDELAPNVSPRARKQASIRDARSGRAGHSGHMPDTAYHPPISDGGAADAAPGVTAPGTDAKLSGPNRTRGRLIKGCPAHGPWHSALLACTPCTLGRPQLAGAPCYRTFKPGRVTGPPCRSCGLPRLAPVSAAPGRPLPRAGAPIPLPCAPSWAGARGRARRAHSGFAAACCSKDPRRPLGLVVRRVISKSASLTRFHPSRK